MLRINNKTYPLTYNGAALFAIKEKYGWDANTLMQTDTPEGIRCLRGVTMIMAEQGELYRRYQGYAPAEMMDDRTVETVASPPALLQLRMAVLEQMMEDRGQKIKARSEDTDLGLVELQRKKGDELSVAHYLRLGTLVGLTAKETMLLPMGTVLDMWELFVKANSRAED